MDTSIRSHWQDKAAWISIAVCVCFLVLDRGLLLNQFGFRYVDDDQAIMWSGAAEMAQGRFHEPCFYGQRYNTMLEGLVAVPLLWLGVGPEVALPLVTSFLSLFPFVLLAWIMVRKRMFFQAALMLVLPVTLSPEFGMISTIPRGFVTGVFLASMAVLPLFSRRGIFLFLSPFFAILALFANPNAALVLVPAAILILLKYPSERRLYLLGIAGALPAAALSYWGHHFYDLHPAYVVHRIGDLSFDLSTIRSADIKYLDHLSPVVWGKGVVVLFFLLTLVVVLAWRKQWKHAFALAMGVVLLVASFGVSKVHDGTSSVYYPWARMFLAIPFLLALFMAQLRVRPLSWVIHLLPIVAAGFFGFKCFAQADAVARQIDHPEQSYIEVAQVEDLERHCLVLDRLARENKADLLVVSWGALKHLTSYGCPCLYPAFPTTFEPALDRRTWLLRSVAGEVAPNVLFTGYAESDFAGPHDPVIHATKVSEEPLIFLVKGNMQRTDSLFSNLGFYLRPY